MKTLWNIIQLLVHGHLVPDSTCNYFILKMVDSLLHTTCTSYPCKIFYYEHPCKTNPNCNLWHRFVRRSSFEAQCCEQGQTGKAYNDSHESLFALIYNVNVHVQILTPNYVFMCTQECSFSSITRDQTWRVVWRHLKTWVSSLTSHQSGVSKHLTVQRRFGALRVTTASKYGIIAIHNL